MIRRKTKERQLVYERAMRLYHPTAEDIFKDIEVAGESVSRATVYRNLSILAEEGDLLAINMHGVGTRYDGNVIPHSHFQCNICGKIFDIPNIDVDIPSFAEGDIMASEVVLYGVCAGCKNK